MEELEIEACKHCGRVVLAGPACCMELLQELLENANKEILWLRKVQSNKDKRIEALQKDLIAAQDAAIKPGYGPCTMCGAEAGEKCIDV